MEDKLRRNTGINPEPKAFLWLLIAAFLSTAYVVWEWPSFQLLTWGNRASLLLVAICGFGLVDHVLDSAFSEPPRQKGINGRSAIRPSDSRA